MDDIKIMLVDDEPPFLEEMRMIVSEYGKNCRVIAEAYIGKQALEMIEKEEPDIVFTDIRMPVLNGIEFAQRLNQMQKDIYIVVISGYASFDYAREAFRADVFDYLLKPIDPDLVNSVLDRLIPLVFEKRYEKTENVLKRTIFSDEAVESKIRDYNAFSFILLKVPLAELEDKQLLSMEYMDIKTEIYRLVKSYLKSSEELWIFPSEISGFVIVVGLSSYREGSLNEICKNIAAYFTDLDIPVSVGLSGEINKLHQFREKYKVMKEDFFNHVLIGKSRILLLHKDLKDENSNPICILDTAKFKILIGAANWSGFKSELINIFSIWEQHNYPQYMVNRALKQITYIFESKSPKSNNSNLLIDKRIDEAVNMAKSFSELIASYWDIIVNKYLSFTDEIKVLKSTDIFTRIDEYIRNNLGSTLSQTDIVEIFGVSQSYICSLFRNNTGLSYIKYVTDLKIDKAKGLLDNSGMNVKDAAMMVGYEDVKYFSRVFKNLTGISPSEYKKRNDNKIFHLSN